MAPRIDGSGRPAGSQIHETKFSKPPAAGNILRAASSSLYIPPARARAPLFQIGVLFPVRRPLLSTNLLRFPPRARSHPQSRSAAGAAHLPEANADAAALLRPHASRPPLVLGLRGYAGAGLNFCRNVFLCDLFFFIFRKPSIAVSSLCRL